MWQNYLQPATLDEALALLREHGGAARPVAGGTDLTVELRRGLRPATTLIDLSRIAALRYLALDGETFRLGALATHNDVVASPDCVARALPLAQASWEVGAPQIRAAATVAGNLVTASPANDTITPLIALDAELALVGLDGERTLPLREFYLGVRRTALRPGELVREVRFRALGPRQRGLFVKLGLRRAQAISVVNLAAVITFDGDDPASAPVVAARIALGCVAPTIVRAAAAEAALVGRALSPEACAEAGRLALEAAAPIDDLRGSAAYRREALAGLVAHALGRIAAGQEREGWPERPVLLQTPAAPPPAPAAAPVRDVAATVNGRPTVLADAAGKTLLDALRDGGLTGTKEGCAEGECGACTVWLDGRAVMACLTPAGQARGAEVTTIEGLAPGEGELHPLQRAFIEQGAVQCGFCIPGMLMAGAKLLAELPDPREAEVRAGLGGNICRCTGYRKIFAAVGQAAGEG